MKKILIPLSGQYVFRNFYTSGAFKVLEKEFDVTYVITPDLKEKIISKSIEQVNVLDEGYRSMVRQYLGYLTMGRYPGRSSTFPVKYQHFVLKNYSFKNKLRTRFLSLPLVCEAYIKVRELLLGTRKDFKDVLRKINPDLILIPTGYADSFSVDWLKASIQTGHKSFWLMLNWDNPSCKGVMTQLPTSFGVWGKQTFEQVVRIHKANPKNVFILGAPQFEVYSKHKESKGCDAASKLQSLLDTSKKIFLIAGVARYRDEFILLRSLEAAVERADLVDIQFIYRPHPAKEFIDEEKNFFDYPFKHINLDPQVEKHYRSMLNDKNYYWKGFAPLYSYYPKLLNSVDGIISSMSTMAIESLIMGKPVLLTSYPDETHSYSFDKLAMYDHHNCWKRIDHTVQCTTFENLIPDIKKLFRVIETKNLEERIKSSVQYVVYDNGEDYNIRLYNTIKTLVRSQ